jgi:hypothetical protein
LETEIRPRIEAGPMPIRTRILGSKLFPGRSMLIMRWADAEAASQCGRCAECSAYRHEDGGIACAIAVPTDRLYDFLWGR